MPLALNDVVLVSYRGEYQSNRIILATAWRVGVAPATGTVADNLDEIAGAFAVAGAGTPLSTYLDMLGTNVNITECRTQRVSPLRSPYVQRVFAQAGTAPTAAGAPNIAGVVSRITLLTGPSQVSNSHLGPIGSGDISAGKVTAGWIIRASAFGVRWTQTVTTVASGIVIEPGIYHPLNAPGLDFSRVVDQRIWDTVRTMHRRTLQLGE